ncbi:MFS transporter [Flavobacterium noncentrifugens]|uniref:Drug resistance transporter, EmrB/QacA subfamily n=1 Tax=Flavobacterium noncentrifugens TaxID=1128970 RepID=A0A1G8UT40_9FLAO|nr:MFS transporter [Flavobacterium noncentrifugens]GEP52593.1 MFS transporter [Flavobacterium noncentrifugens]SDJ56717.1 drug resistance transporter, EmrB/QacA subfamily [Flavobacterium noncentrifugens]
MATISLKSTDGKWLMVSTIMASGMAFIDGSALNVVLPSLQEKLHATSAELFWVLNSYLLILASLVLVGGTLGDSHGRKKIFMYGILIFIIGSVLCGLSPNVSFLIIFRAIQGIGGALMIPGSLSLISSSINEDERGKAIGTWSSITTMVSVSGPILGGFLGDHGLWRYIFFINVPIGIAALLILWKKVSETELAEQRSIDFVGGFLLAAGLALLTFGFLRAPEVGFGHWQSFGALSLGSVFLLIFIIVEWKSSHPMMPLELFRNPTFSGVNLLTLFLYAGLNAAMLFMSLNLVQVQGYSQMESGLTFVPFTIIMVLISRFAGSLADKHGPRWLLILGPFTVGIGMLVLSFIGQTQGPKSYWVTFFPGILIFSMGMAFTVAPLTTAVMTSVKSRYSGRASGVNNAISRVSNVLANAIFGSLALVLFTSALQSRLIDSQFSQQEKSEILAQAGNLGNAKVPMAIEAKKRSQVSQDFHASFIASYQNIMMLASGLCFAGSLVSVIFVRKKDLDQSKGTQE